MFVYTCIYHIHWYMSYTSAKSKSTFKHHYTCKSQTNPWISDISKVSDISIIYSMYIPIPFLPPILVLLFLLTSNRCSTATACCKGLSKGPGLDLWSRSTTNRETIGSSSNSRDHFGESIFIYLARPTATAPLVDGLCRSVPTLDVLFVLVFFGGGIGFVVFF